MLQAAFVLSYSSQQDGLIVKPKHPKGEDGYKVFSIRIKEETVAKVDAISMQTGRSHNELIGKFLDYAVER